MEYEFPSAEYEYRFVEYEYRFAEYEYRFAEEEESRRGESILLRLSFTNTQNCGTY